MKKRLTALVILCMMCLTSAFGVGADVYVGFMPGPAVKGPIAYDVNLEAFTDGSGVSYTGSALSFTSGSTAKLAFYLPFDAISADITYTAENGANLTVKTSALTDVVALAAGSETTLNHVFSSVVRKGEFTLELAASGAVSLLGITFNKAPVKRPASGVEVYSADNNMTEEQKALMSAVLVDRAASMLMVNGGKRYIDYDAADTTGDIIDGRLYLPAKTLARALGYYIEDYPARHYMLLRHERVEYCFTDSIYYKETYNGYDTPVRESIANPIIYKNGKSYLPVREFAESLGKTVGFRDGIAVIDDKYSVANIIENDALFAHVQSLFAPFHPDAAAEGRTLYVSQNHANASDDADNAGTEAVPFKTLAKAAEEAEAGDTVLIGSGTYRETLKPKNSGTATAPIVFRAMEGAEVIISALEEVSGFTAGSNGVYTATVNWDLGKQKNQVFYNGDMLTEARFPNSPNPVASGAEPYDAKWPVKGDLRVYTSQAAAPSRYNPAAVVSNSGILDGYAKDHWKGGTFVGLFGDCYWMKSAEILGSESGKLIIEEQDSTSFDNAVTYSGWGWGYIVGHKNCMDAAGEWVLENNTLSLIPPKGASTSGLTVEVKRRMLVADLSGKSYIQLKGIKTIGGSMLMNEAEMCVVNGCEILYNNHFLRDDDCVTSSYVQGSMQAGVNGIYVSGSNNAFVNNDIKEAAGAAIAGSGTYHYLENNYIENCGYAGIIASIHFTAENWKSNPNRGLRGGHSIYQNTVARSGRCVMTHGGSNNGSVAAVIPEEIAFNDFHDGFVTSLDAGITYEYMVNMGTEKLNTQYHNNYVYTTRPGSDKNLFSFGIYHDGSTQSVDTYNNVIFTTDNSTRISSGGSNPGDQSVHTATLDVAWANCDKWNNIALVGITGGAQSLTAQHFPDQRPFYAGAIRDGGEYLANYNRIVGGESEAGITKFVKDATLSSGASLDGNVAYLSAGQSATFTVNLGTTGANSFLVGFLGDKYEEGAAYELTIGSQTYSFTLSPTAKTEDRINMQQVLLKTVSGNVASFRTFTGTQTVKLKCVSGDSVGLLSIMPRKW